MTLEQYMRELWLMDKQYGQEEELYPLINMLLRDGANTENLSIRDVHKGKSAKNDKSRKYIDGFGSFPDLAIFGENFPEGQEPKNVEEGENTILKNIYGCVEAKSTGSKLIKCLDHNTMEIGYKEEENDNYVQINIVKEEINYYVQINTEKTSLVEKKKMVANDAGELLGELLWYGKVLYTNGLIWKYYALSKKSEEKINGIRKNWIIADKNEGATSPDGKDKNKNWKKERKTWIFKQCKEKPLKIISKNIGDLTKIYNKIKDNTSMPAFNEFNSQDYQEWKNLKTNLAAIDWTEVIF